MARRKPMVSALPFTLVTTFLCFPFVSSRGFRALAPCDCFAYVEGGAACFLHGDYSVRCDRHESGRYMPSRIIQTTAWLAIILYACVVPLGYATLLFVCRRELKGSQPPTTLSRSLKFLTKDYQPRAFFWELIEVARKITVTGFLALVDPGSLLQLYLGVAVALCILVLQMYASPYQTLSDNFLSMISASALVLTMFASLGIQLTELAPELSTLGQAETGLGANSLPVIVMALIASALVVLVVAGLMFAQQLHVAWQLPFARWEKDGIIATPRLIVSTNVSRVQSSSERSSVGSSAKTNEWHAFVSQCAIGEHDTHVTLPPRSP